MWELQAPGPKLPKGYHEKLGSGSIPFIVFSVVEKKQHIMLTWGKENKWPCRSITLWHGCGNKTHSFWGMVLSHDPLQFLICHSSFPCSSKCIPLCQWRLGLQAPYSGRVEKVERQHCNLARLLLDFIFPQQNAGFDEEPDNNFLVQGWLGNSVCLSLWRRGEQGVGYTE